MSVTIVGAGIVGCACAFELARAGVEVTVLDPRGVGRGASQASAGVLAPYIEGHPDGPLRALGRRSLDLYDAFVQHVLDRSGVPLQYERGGTLEVAVDTDHAERLRASAETLRREHVSASWLEREDLLDIEPLTTADAIGGLLIDVHGFVRVGELTDALAAAARRCGARIIAGAKVIALSPAAGGGVSIETENNTSRADHVVLAAGSWSGQVRVAGVAAPVAVKPVRGQLLQLAWTLAQPLRYVLWGTDCYIVPWLNGRVLVGATVEDAGFDERATAAGVRDLLEAGCSLVPHLWQASFEDVRVGLRPGSPDGLPIVGRSAVIDGLIYATGHYRNGVLLAPLTAALVKGLILNEPADPALDTLAPSRLGTL